MNQDKLAGNLARVLDRIRTACERVGRDPGSIRLIAVTKYVEADVIRRLIALGVHDLGENRLQVALPKINQLAKHTQLAQESNTWASTVEGGSAGGGANSAEVPGSVRWHFIGRLQTNKAKQVINLFSEIHSIDRLELVHEIDRRLSVLRENGTPKKVPVFLQVNTSGEVTKAGVDPEDARSLGEYLLDSKDMKWVGLMTMAPEVQDQRILRLAFAGLRELRDRLSRKLDYPLPRLSMGMSNDFETAIEEGATDVRIGSLLFEGA